MGIKGTTTAAETNRVEIELELKLSVSPEQAFAAFIDIGNWWEGGDFQVGRELSQDMRLDARPGGFWAEDWGDGNFHIWALVVTCQAGKLLRLSIPEGSQWSEPGTVEVRFDDAESGCRLSLIHRCNVGTGNWDHEAYIPHWQAQVAERYRQFAETGSVEDSVRSMAGKSDKPIE